ncbi:MAG TPA: nucleotide exchange factor GrpE [Verrucomicrobiae bacterium]|jgi:molecular chaperone GrpE
MNKESPSTESPKPASAPDPATPGPQADHAELAALKDRHLRLAADFENYKRRAREDADRRAAGQRDELLKDILPVLDNLKRALESAADDASPLRTGVELTLQQLRQVLRQNGCEPDECVNQVFDPRRQEAIGSRHDSSRPDHVVLEIVQEGWRRGGELLRPAKVIINDLAAATDARSSRTCPGENEHTSTPIE